MRMMIGNADPGLQAAPARDQDPGGLSLDLGRPLVVGTLAGMALIAAGPDVAPSADQALAAGPGVACNLSAGQYNTILCPRTPKGGEQYCARATTIQEPGNLRGGYVDGLTNYSISFKEPEGLTGCSPAGHRQVSVFEELRQGPAGSFERHSPVVVVRTKNPNSPFTGREKVKAPVNCSLPGMAGSAVRPVVQVTWVTAKGWPKLPKSAASATFEGKAKPVC